MTDGILRAMEVIVEPAAMIRRVSNYLNGRLFEWYATANMLGIGVMICLYPNSLQWSAFKYILTHFISSSVVGLGCLVVGYVGIVALIVNGRSEVWGPRARAWGAAVRAVIWFQLWYSLLVFAISDTGTPSIGLVNWALLFFGEIIVGYRAATYVKKQKPDVGRNS